MALTGNSSRSKQAHPDMISESTGQRGSDRHFAFLPLRFGRGATQFVMMMVGEGIAPSTTTPE
jgi:hypothetical protein